MALSRKTGTRFQSAIWPGFVDAMTGLLLVLMFVLTIFMVLQFVLQETISGQETELSQLSAEVAALADALGLERDRSASLTAQVGSLFGELDLAEQALAQAEGLAEEQSALISRLTRERDGLSADLSDAQSRITGFEAQVAGLLAQRREALAQIATLEAEQAEAMSEQEALNLALAQARSEIDQSVEEARLAAARRSALEAMVADLERENTAAETQISDLEAARLVDAAAAQALRDRLANADTELTAMTLALEEQRRQAEDTLTLLAAAQAARAELDALFARIEAERAELAADLATSQAGAEDLSQERASLEARLAAALQALTQAEDAAQAGQTEAERQAALLAVANTTLAEQQALSAQSRREVSLLNEQLATLRTEMSRLQGLLDLAEAEDVAANVRVETLTQNLNSAMARALLAERRANELEAAEVARLAAETERLERYRSDFLGLLRDVLEGVEGVRIEGDRFVFSSEVLFEQGAADLSPEGKLEIAKVASILRDVASDIPDEIEWVIRVDGHTDNLPLSGFGEFANNWELSQARALSVVLYMVDSLDIPPERLAANGFGQYQPINPEDTAAARAQNRRIELKLTER